VVREFDVSARAFVPGGFVLPEAKSNVEWISEDELFVGTDLGPGTLTSSGYPREVRVWKRGQALALSEQVFAGSLDDVSVSAWTLRTSSGELKLISRNTDFFNGETYLLRGRSGAYVAERLAIPSDATVAGVFKDKLIVWLKSDWQRGGQTF